MQPSQYTTYIDWVVPPANCVLVLEAGRESEALFSVLSDFILFLQAAEGCYSFPPKSSKRI